jgi:nitrate reductase assembly molybdenum cofactor insertion protein NarJ
MNPLLDERQRRLLAEAAEWRMISLLLECPAAGWREKVAALAPEVADRDLAAAAEAALSEATEGAYHSLFGPGGPVAPREVSHGRLVEFGHLLAELEAQYQAFAYQPQTAEPADHASVEAGFVAYLRLKEAYALACGDAERAAVTAEAARRFLEDHLGVLVRPLAAALERSGLRYLEGAGRALLRRVPETAPALPILGEDET